MTTRRWHALERGKAHAFAVRRDLLDEERAVSSVCGSASASVADVESDAMRYAMERECATCRHLIEQELRRGAA